MPTDFPTRTCSCGADIIWAFTEKEKRTPFDAEPSRTGTFSLHRDGSLVLSSYVPVDLRNGEPLYVPHWATCPDAASHRR